MNETLQNKTIIKVTNLTKDYLTESQTVRAVNNVNLEVKSGEFITFVGRSGSGKTTLLNLISVLDYPTEGKILFDGEYLEKLVVLKCKYQIGFYEGMMGQKLI